MSAPIPKPITGSEKLETADTPFAALVHFYRAFNARDLDGVAANWEQAPTIAMDNPLGGIKRGWAEIRSVYERIFRGPARVYVEFFDYAIQVHGEVFVAVGRERGTLEKDGRTLALAIRTSRIFRRTVEGWKQIHHHGSIEEPALLERYQKTVAGQPLAS